MRPRIWPLAGSTITMAPIPPGRSIWIAKNPPTGTIATMRAPAGWPNDTSFQRSPANGGAAVCAGISDAFLAPTRATTR